MIAKPLKLSEVFGKQSESPQKRFVKGNTASLDMNQCK